jgi:hypothetical protein
VSAGFRCADDAAARGERLAGTASRADRFVLIEFPTPWPSKAIEVFGDARLREAVAEAVSAATAKVLLVRRPGQRTGEERRWAVVDARSRRALWGSWQSQDDLDALVAAIGVDATDEWSDTPIVLVCTHARHDACCGVWGRPVAAALAQSHADLTWESSHVGGHRFAGNVVFPVDGTYYGRVDAADATALVDQHLGAAVRADHLRGFSWLDPAAQAVAVEAHRRWGPASAGAIASASLARVGDDRWRVELTCNGELPSSIAADVERVSGPDARLSCHADPTPTESFVIRSLVAGSQ